LALYSPPKTPTIPERLSFGRFAMTLPTHSSIKAMSQ
jgi:hypothetical protein